MAHPIGVALLAAVLVLAPHAAHAVNKCTDAVGQVTYSDAPCPGAASAAQTVRVQPNVVEGRPAGDQQLRTAAERSAWLRGLVAAQQVAIGMTESELVTSWGEPSVVNTDRYGGGRVHKQWVYRRGPGGAAQYVYTEGGVVTAIQDRPGHGAGGERAAREPCYSALDIRNAQTEASSITLSPETRRLMLQRIAEMKRC